jgi:predicted phage baseplate assembly protein
LFYPKVIGNSVKVFVNEGLVVNGIPSAVEYQYVERLFNSAANDRMFSLIVNAANQTEVVFGNGVNGRIPSAGQTIEADYRHGVGAQGNVAANRITQIIDSPSPYISQLYSTAAIGGANVESITSLKTNIPAAFATQDRAVSLQDYKDLVLGIAGVSKGSASYSSGIVTIYAAPFTEDYLTHDGASLSVSSALQDAIITYYEPRQMIGASVTAASAIALTAVDITATVYVLPSFVASSVKTAVENALNEFFDFDAVFFNQILSKGQIYRKMLDVPGVDYVTVSLPSSETVTSGEYGLLKKGTYTITTSGGITGT